MGQVKDATNLKCVTFNYVEYEAFCVGGEMTSLIFMDITSSNSAF